MKNGYRVLVTPYKNPDLDGTACAYAYAEYQCKSGINALTAIFGKPRREAQFVLDKFNITYPNNVEEYVKDASEIIIVDASDLRGLSEYVDPNRVIEVIDHRKVNETNRFINAKIQIELVGSAATLIGEKFYDSNTLISEKSATLLYSAIISNTINFKAKVTTERDLKISEWLKKKISLPENYISEMFTEKSKLNKPLKEVFIEEFARFDFNGCNIGIAQLEIVNVDSFIQKHLQEIKEILANIKNEKSLDAIFLSCIDIEKGFNVIVTIDKEAENILENILSIKFNNEVAKTGMIFMRKEIVPMIKEYMA